MVKIIDIFRPETNRKVELPLVVTKVPAGFPSPADDYIEKKLDLNELIVKHPAATFFVRVEGESMVGAGIHSNDILVVDRSLEAGDGRIVVAMLGGEFTVKRIRREGGNDGEGGNAGRIWLLPENPQFKPVEVTAEMNAEIWGVVTYVIHEAK